MSAPLSLALPDADATEALGRRLAAVLPRGGLAIALSGPLGAGKSALARAVLRGLGVVGAIPSPSYTLVEPYEIGARSAYHVDLYRLADADEAGVLGLAELAPGAVMLVEWPERGAEGYIRFDLAVELAHADPGRALRARALTPPGAQVLAALGMPA